MNGPAIIFGSIALATYMFARPQAYDVTSGVPKAQLECMGLAGMQPMPDAAGNQVRGNWSICGGSGAIGIPLNSAGEGRLVVPVNRLYLDGFLDLRAVILRDLLEAGKDAELIPTPPAEF